MSPHRAAPLRRACSLAAALALVACSPDTSRGPVAPTAPALSATRAALPFHGTVDSASHTSVYDPEADVILVHLVGTGTATHLGRYTLTSDLELDRATVTGPERMTLTAANGDTLFATGTGRGTPSEDGLTLDTMESMTITGGTGRFAGATGSLILKQVIVEATLFSSGSFDGTISFGK